MVVFFNQVQSVSFTNILQTDNVLPGLHLGCSSHLIERCELVKFLNSGFSNQSTSCSSLHDIAVSRCSPQVLSPLQKDTSMVNMQEQQVTLSGSHSSHKSHLLTLSTCLCVCHTNILHYSLLAVVQIFRLGDVNALCLCIFTDHIVSLADSLSTSLVVT